jgi:hypothetical protein
VAGFSARRSISQYRFSATELSPAFAAAGSPALIRRLGIVQVLEARKFLSYFYGAELRRKAHRGIAPERAKRSP